jgi:DeoR/GlpR family transcriptional regulator of sugar metabolism
MSIVEDRRARIIEGLEQDGVVSVAAMCDALGVSEMTVRRDLAELETQGVLRRFHGGAALLRGRAHEPPYLMRAARGVEAKARIATRVASLIPDGESVAMSYGTTAVAVGRALAARANLTVVTPNLRVALDLASAPGVRVVMTGGVLRPGELSLWGYDAEQTFQQYFCDTAVVGAAGIDATFGMTEYHFDEVAVVQAMATGAKRVIAAVDGSKIGVIAFAHVLPATQLDVIVTSEDAPADVVQDLRDLGVEVITV